MLLHSSTNQTDGDRETAGVVEGEKDLRERERERDRIETDRQLRKGCLSPLVLETFHSVHTHTHSRTAGHSLVNLSQSVPERYCRKIGLGEKASLEVILFIYLFIFMAAWHPTFFLKLQTFKLK